jgi:nucleotide-binding universal stress UspA family protein
MSFEHPFARIVVAYDGSPPADAALARAIALADQFGGDVVLAHVSDAGAPTVLALGTKSSGTLDVTTPVEHGLDISRRELLQHAAQCVASSTVPVAVDFSTNGVVAGVLDAANRWNASGIAVGTRDLSAVSRTLIASTTDGILRNAQLPVIVVREGQSAADADLKRCVVGLDSSQPSEGAAAFAVALALEHGTRLVFCSVVEEPGLDAVAGAYGYDPTASLHELRAMAHDALDTGLQYANALDVYPDTEIIDARSAPRGLLDAARRQNADAIVVGTHGRRFLERILLGSTAESAVRRSDVPVIVVPVRALLASTAGAVRGV